MGGGGGLIVTRYSRGDIVKDIQSFQTFSIFGTVEQIFCFGTVERFRFYEGISRARITEKPKNISSNQNSVIVNTKTV